MSTTQPFSTVPTDDEILNSLGASNMAEKVFKPVGNSSNTWDFETQGVLQGVYLRTDNQIETKRGIATKHFFKLMDGSEVSVWGGTQLNNTFGKEVKSGQEVQIKYQGKKQGKLGMFKAYAISVAE